MQIKIKDPMQDDEIRIDVDIIDNNFDDDHDVESPNYNATGFGQFEEQDAVDDPDDIVDSDLREMLETLIISEVHSNRIPNDENNIENELLNDVQSDEEVPLVTVKNHNSIDTTDAYNYEDNLKQFDDSHRTMVLQILDILLSEIISRTPLMYSFYGENYRFVHIVGTVVKKDSTKANKSCIAVDDGTGYIPCIIEDTETDLEIESKINDLEKACALSDGMDKNEMLAFAEMDDTEFLENIVDKEDDFLKSVTKMGLTMLKKQREKCPLTADIKIGDNVAVGGIVSDYKEQRYIFAKYLSRLSSLSPYFDHMTDVLKKRKLLLKNKCETQGTSEL